MNNFPTKYKVECTYRQWYIELTSTYIIYLNEFRLATSTCVTKCKEIIIMNNVRHNCSLMNQNPQRITAILLLFHQRSVMPLAPNANSFLYTRLKRSARWPQAGKTYF